MTPKRQFIPMYTECHVSFTHLRGWTQMQPMTHNSGAAGIGSQVIANGSRGLATGTVASAGVTALVPAGADEVSVLAALAFAAEGVETLAQNTFAQQELTRAGAAVVQIAGIYDAVDAANAGTLS